ncbi:MAG: hypothetical protein IID05_07625 [Gemmatimonadetes bacterium]|nr:hypothetical protein [Gemmatimonadota bacterium]MCH7714632.1 hypothetical protein [Gemmatimonadota bacterium]
MALPPGEFIRAILFRGLVIWFGMKLVVTAGAAALRQSGETESWLRVLQLTPSAVLLLTGFVTWLVIIDAGRRNELLFLANLGVARYVIGSLAAVPSITCEIIIGLM